MAFVRLTALGILVGMIAAAPVDAALKVTKRRDGSWLITNGGTASFRHRWDDAQWLISQRNRQTEFDATIEKYATEHGLDPMLVRCVILIESSFDPLARSRKGAVGLMQLMPGTASRMGVTRIWDPEDNIRGGTKYLRYLVDLFRGDLELALAGYNAGENAVIQNGYRIPPYAETQDYVRKVLTAFYGTPRLGFQRTAVPISAKTSSLAAWRSKSGRAVISTRSAPNAAPRVARLGRSEE